MILQSLVGETDAAPPLQKSRPIGRDNVGEATPKPQVPMQPESPAHRVDHTGAAVTELKPVAQQRHLILGRRERQVRRSRRVRH